MALTSGAVLCLIAVLLCNSYADDDYPVVASLPKATAYIELSLYRSQNTFSLVDVAQHLSRAMDAAGYFRRSYYWLDGAHSPGIAIVSDVEQINANGTPFAQGRWLFQTPTYQHFSIKSFLSAVSGAQVGHYRLLVFVVSAKPMTESTQVLSLAETKNWVFGPASLPPAASEIQASNAYHCVVFIYEFQRATRDDAPVFHEWSQLSAKMHLARSGLLSALEKEF